MPGSKAEPTIAPEPMPTGMPEMGEPQDVGPDFNQGGENPEDMKSGGDSEIDDIFSKLDTEKQAAVIKYAKSMVDGDAVSESEDSEEDLVTEITNEVLNDRQKKPEDDEDKKIRNKKVTVSNPFISKNFQKVG